LFGIVAGIRKFRFKHATPSHGMFIFWVIWLATMYGFFSFASFYHRYYLCMLAPGIAGLVGIGLVQMYRSFRDKQGWRQWLLPVSLLVTCVTEVVYIWSYSALRTWLVPITIVFAIAAFVLMFLHYKGTRRFARFIAIGCMLVSILAGPFYWSLTPVIYVPENVTMPYAGPELSSQTKTPGMTANQETYVSTDSKTLALEKYLVAHYKAGSYLVVSQRANDVAGFIIDTGLPAVAYGGFLGSDQAMTVDQLKQLVSEGKITYFLLSEQGGFGGNSNSDISTYVKANAKLIDPSEYGVGSSSGRGDSQSSYSLYCFIS
jgi:4-amino-4-deoxy-L-arabinose transferase-like glycosyltransferase